MLDLPKDNPRELPSAEFAPEIEREAQMAVLRSQQIDERIPVQGFTLDAMESKDLDDAIWLERSNGEWRVLVTISDVDALVPMGSLLDREAVTRVTSHYFPERSRDGKVEPKYVIPMLPTILSEKHLSLQEGESRLTLTVEMLLTGDFRPISADIKRTRLVSAKKLGLSEYGDRKIIGDPGLPLRDYYHMAKGLNHKRWSDPGWAYQELKNGISTNEDGMVREGSLSAASLIVQEFMVLTNQAVAELLNRENLAAPFRNHLPARNSPPTKAQIRAEIERNSDYRKLVDDLRATYQKLLGSALYEAAPAGHFGLGIPAYTHFTSPIRRYADLVIHRIVKAHLSGAKSPYTPEEIQQLCLYLNKRNRDLATIRAHQERRHSLKNYRQFGHLLPKEKEDGPDYMESLLTYLRDNRIGNAFFEYSCSEGFLIQLSCKASVRFQRIRHVVEVTARAALQDVKNEAARLLLEKIQELMEANPPEQKKKDLKYQKSPESPETGPGVVARLYQYCEEHGFPVPSIYYESWNGGLFYNKETGEYSVAREPGCEKPPDGEEMDQNLVPIVCHCDISASLTMDGFGRNRQTAKEEAARKMLDYLQSGQPIPRQSIVPPAPPSRPKKND